MEAEASGRNSPVLSNSSSSSDDSEDEGRWEGRTFIDFGSDDSIPNLVVKTFLQDCLKHPKILLHKEFQFFRSYLKELGVSFEMPANAPVSENHEEYKFCLDRGDEWLEALKERVKPENTDFYWASIIPVRRRSDIGLVVFKWEPHPLSIHLLQLYIAFCRKNSEIVSAKTGEVIGQDEENVDDYIQDFLRLFDPERNMDVEEVRKGANEAAEYRKRNNLKEPSRTDLLYLFRRQPTTTTISKPRGKNKRKHSSSGESDSSSSSSESSGCSEYKGNYSVRGHRKTKKRKIVPVNIRQAVKRSSRTSGSASLPLRIKELLKKLKLPRLDIILKRCDDEMETRSANSNPSVLPPMRSIQIKVTRCDNKINMTPARSQSKDNSDALASRVPASGPTNNANKPFILEPTNEVVQPAYDSTASNRNDSNSVTSSPASPANKVSENNNNNDPIEPMAAIGNEVYTKPISDSATHEDSNAKLNEAMISTDFSNGRPTKKPQPNSPKSKYSCEICWFGTSSFPTEKLLERHMIKEHSPQKRGCGCGSRMKKASLESHAHQQLCKKTINNGVKPNI